MQEPARAQERRVWLLTTPGAAGYGQAQLVNPRDLVRREDQLRVRPGRPHLPPERRLALCVPRDGLVLGDREHEPGHSRSEARSEVSRVRASLLDCVMEDARGDHVIVRAGVVEQQRDLERVLDERSGTEAAPLARVLSLPVGDRGTRLREARYQIG